jgi:hypothetical protein
LEEDDAMTVALAEELTLIGYRDDGRPITEALYLDLGLAGAHLVDLALRERIRVDDGHVVVTDPGPTGSRVLDAVLRRIADAAPRTPEEWITELGVPDTRQAVLDHLVSRGVLEHRSDRALLVFPRTRYPAASGGEPTVETDARRRLHAVVTGPGVVEPRTAALCTLVDVLGWRAEVFGDLPESLVTARLAALDRTDWGAEAVREALLTIQRAVATTIALLIIPFAVRRNS